MISPGARGAARVANQPAGSPLASLARAAYGLALICWPGRLIRLRTGEPPSRRACAVGRVLGVRHVTQAVISTACPSGLVLGAGVTADVAHAGSMVILAALDQDLRRALLTDAAIAAALAAAGGASLRDSTPAA
jgi:hypothetical protein